MNAEEFYAQFKEMLSYLGLRWGDKHLAKVGFTADGSFCLSYKGREARISVVKEKP